MSDLKRRTFLSQVAVLSASTALSPMVSANSPVPPTKNRSLAYQISDRLLTPEHPWSEWSEEHARDGSSTLFQVIDYVLTPETITPNSNLLIFADRIVIRGECSLPGRDVFLFAREIVAESGSAIRVNGIAGNPPPPKRNGENAGQSGYPGSKGARGSKGGRIRIVAGHVKGLLTASADGGIGGKGQAGGDGQPGTAGYQATIGGRGGSAAEGGIGGAGNDGGSIELFVLQTPEVTPSFSYMGGRGAQAGADGQPGSGGQPGGSYRCNCQRICDDVLSKPDPELELSVVTRPTATAHDVKTMSPMHHGFCYWECDFCGSSGSLGPGQSILRSPTDMEARKGENGAIGTATIKIAEITEISPFSRYSQLRMTMHRCSTDYLNQQATELAERLVWVANLSIERTITTGVPIDQFGGGLQPVTPASISDWASLHGRVAVLLRRLSLGLDYFGYAQTYVSVLSDGFAEELLKKRLAYAASIEACYERFFTTKRSIDEQRGDIKLAMISKTTFITDTTAVRNDTDTRVAPILTEIKDLNGKLESNRVAIIAADEAFKRAVANRHGGCSLGDMVHFAINVYLIANGGFAAAGGLIDTFKKVESLNWKDNLNIDGAVKNIHVIQDTFKEKKVGESFSDFQKGYETLKNTLHDDETKIAVSMENFEKVLDDYAGMPEAEHYRDLMRLTARLAQQKNEALLLYTALVLQSKELELNITAAHAEITRLTTELAITDNPMQQQFVIFMGDSLVQAKQLVIEALDLRRRAISYQGLQRLTLHYNDETVSALENSANDVDSMVKEAYLRRNGANQKRDIVIMLEKTTDSHLLSQFSRTGRASIYISPKRNEIASLLIAGVVGVSVDINIKGARLKFGATELKLRMVHEGRAVFIDPASEYILFQHQPRPTLLSYKRSHDRWVPTTDIENNLRGNNEQYIHLSVCGGWAIEVLNLKEVDLTGLTSIDIKFQCEFIPQDQSMPSLPTANPLLKLPIKHEMNFLRFI